MKKIFNVSLVVTLFIASATYAIAETAPPLGTGNGFLGKLTNLAEAV